MEKKYHLVNGEPKLCTASIRGCPVGGEHFTSADQGRKSYENNNSDKLFAPIKKKRTLAGDISNIKDKLSDSLYDNDALKVGAVVATGLVVGGGALGVALHHDNNINNQANKTPYSVSVSVYDTGAQPYHGYVVDSNLKHSNFSECAPRQDNPKYISCTTEDGKFTITSKPRIGTSTTTINKVVISDHYQTLDRMQVKDNTNNKIVNDTHSRESTNSNIYIPAMNNSK